MKKSERISDVVEILSEESEIIEEFLEFPEEDILTKNSTENLIRMDMNVIEYPLFSKNKRRKKNQTVIYYFDERRDKYIEVKPISGSTIPGEFEEKIFIALIRIMRKYNYGRNFFVSNAEILENLGILNQGTRNGMYTQVKNALLKLTETSYTFKNSLYSNDLGGIIENAVITSIMNIQILSKRLAKGNELTYFDDGRIREIYKVSLSDYFYTNIIKKGYLVYDADILLNITSSTARGIYLLITKWRFEKLYLKVKVITLLKRIPLKHDEKNIGRSIKTIEQACQELKNKKLITKYNLISLGKLAQTEIEFFFNENHNFIKQENFYEDKNIFDKTLISFTEQTESVMEKLVGEELLIDEEDELLFENRYKNLSKEKQSKIDKIVYRDYIETCGMETPVQKIAFRNGKKGLIISYLKEHGDIEVVENNKKKKSSGKNLYLSSEELKLQLDKQLNFYGNIFDFDDETIFLMKFDIGKKIIEEYCPEKITLDELLNIIKLSIKNKNKLDS